MPKKSPDADTVLEPTNISLRSAHHLDQELSMSIEEIVNKKRAFAYAITEDQGVFTAHLADADPDPYRILTRIPTKPTRGEVVALCMVMTGWMSRIDEDADEDDDTPAERERVRVIASVSDDGVSCVVRRYNSEGESEAFEDGGEGIFPEAMRAWWVVSNAI